MKPIIAISPRFGATDEGDRRLELKLDYAEAISRAGGVPIIVPPCADLGALADHVDAWMVPGGGDIHPSIYGEAPHERVYGLDPGRFAFERSLWDVWKGKPYLGICYGCQLLNVLYGGSLVQHVPDVVGHEEHGSGAVQTYTFVEGSRLHGILGPHAQGRSYHHQSVGRVADGLCVTARAEDGIIEGVEAAGDVWHVGVQWHPETTLDSPDSQRLFAAFVRAAGGGAVRRLVNGSEVELADSGAVVEPLGDRLLVRTPEGTHTALVAKVGDQTLVSYRGRRFLVEPVRHSVGGGAASSGEVHAPMPGQITEVLVEVGATVEAGDKLLVLESMKTQQSLIAPVAGQVVRLAVSVGDQVQHDQMLALVEPLAQ